MQRATPHESRILAAREIDITREICFWTLDEQKTTAHHAFPAAEIARAVDAARRR